MDLYQNKKALDELSSIYLQLDEISADTALSASKGADKKRGQLAAAGDKEGAAKKAKQASDLYKAAAEKRKTETSSSSGGNYPKGKGADYKEGFSYWRDELREISVEPVPKDPALEHIDALGGKPFQAFRGQDHRAHITAHLNFMATNMVRNAPSIMAALEKNCLEHISLMAQEQIELEFAEKIKMLQQMSQQAQQDPMMQKQLQQLSLEMESRKAVLISEMMGDFMEEEKKITSQFDSDPLLKLKAREVDLKAMENERKKRYDESRADLDRAKLVQAKEIAEDKMDQNEDLAKLRAGVSLAKAGNPGITAIEIDDK